MPRRGSAGTVMTMGADDYRWDDHWRRFAVATLANPGQALRRRAIFRLLGEGAAAPAAAILDFGCGSGDLLNAMAARFPGVRLAGVDGSAEGLAITARALPGATLAQCDFTVADGIPGELRGWASHVVCSEVLEHVDDPVRVLVNAWACLKPGGRLVVTVPGGPMSAFDKAIGHRGHYTRERLADEMRRAGLRVETAAAAGFPVFNLYRMLVLLRGRRLIADIEGGPTPLARAVMAPLRWLMPLTLDDSPWGWLIVGAAVRPA
ncbi:MAG: class I SAM-dependent methyltransferase [Rhodospirillales bacterium]|nr:class I SAM-dependent methyltransferase [Rhodospirillales bacterium]